MAKLETALCATADALAALMVREPRVWRGLCRREPGELIALRQYHDCVGIGDELVPQLVIGQRVIELMVERHPDVCPRDPVGSA